MAFLFGIRSQGQIISCVTKEITCSAVQILSTEQRQRRRRRALSLVSCIKSKRKRRQSACNIFSFPPTSLPRPVRLAHKTPTTYTFKVYFPEMKKFRGTESSAQSGKKWKRSPRMPSANKEE